MAKLKYVALIRIPTEKPTANLTIFSKETALTLLEELKNKYNVISEEWVEGDLLVECEVEI